MIVFYDFHYQYEKGLQFFYRCVQNLSLDFLRNSILLIFMKQSKLKYEGGKRSEKCKCNAKRKEGKAFYSQSAPVPKEALFWIIDFLLHLNFCAENCIKRSALHYSVGSSWSNSQTRPVVLLEFSYIKVLF